MHLAAHEISGLSFGGAHPFLGSGILSLIRLFEKVRDAQVTEPEGGP